MKLWTWLLVGFSIAGISFWLVVVTHAHPIPTRPAFIEVFLDDNKLYYRPVDSQETEGVLLYEN